MDGVFSGAEALDYLKQLLISGSEKGRKMFLLADSNTSVFCLPVLDQMCSLSDFQVEIILIEAGEKSKNLESLAFIWSRLTKLDAGRDALLFCVGGGMVTDLGGFAASAYKRGIDVVHIPTSLLGMVDASIGGKTGIDFEYLKNHIGAFYWPLKVLIFPVFLKTLPERELLSGFGELLKYRFIAQHSSLNLSPEKRIYEQITPELIQACAAIKLEIVIKDPFEKSVRKWLNFGHTIGHAFESYALQHNIELYHGEAVAAGMLCELWLSAQFAGLNMQYVSDYREIYFANFTPFVFPMAAAPDLLYRMGQDKKNRSGKLSFVLIENMAKPVSDVIVSEDWVIKSLGFYQDCVVQRNIN